MATHPDWTIDPARARATDRSGLVLVARPLPGNEYSVQPLAGTLPQGLKLSPVEQAALDEAIGRRVQEGGHLLVRALARCVNS